MDKKEEYAQVCFELKENQNKLLEFDMGTFVFNPEINTLIDKITELEETKKALEAELEESDGE